MEESDVEFPLKSKLCVFCAERIADDDSEAFPISQETFLRGISTLCEILNATEECKKFGKVTEWGLLKGEDIVRFVCCQRCGLRLEEMLSMHQLILATQVSLSECVRQIENCVIESTKRVDGEDLEYCVNACVHFRESILRSTSRRTSSDIPEVRKRNSSRLRSKSSRVNPIEASGVTEDTNPATPSNFALVSTPFVTLERLKLPVEEIDNDTPTGVCYEATSNDPASDHSNADTSIDFRTGHNYENDKNEDKDEDYVPVPRRRMGNGKRKRGRPRTQTNVEKILKKRGRPRKQKLEDDTDVLVRRTGEILKVEAEELERDSDQEAQNIEEEEYQPSDHNTDGNKELRRGCSKRSRSSLRSRRRIKAQDGQPKEKKKPGRPAKVGSRCYRSQHEEGPKHHKPVYILDLTHNILMFYNVKFQKSHYFLQCLHPDCSHSEPLTGHFTDQTAFRNFRFHVRHHHRNPYKCVGDSSKNLYYCHLCDSHLESRDLLMEHRRTLHPNFEMPPVLCEICGDSMPQSHIVKHTISHKNQEEKELALAEKRKRSGQVKDITKPLFFPCDQCTRTFKTHTELRIHKETHVPVEIRRQFVCDVCGKKFIKLSTVEHHKRRVHLKDLPTPLVCQICNRKFPLCEKIRYDEHIRTHTGAKPFQCQTCGKSFHGKWNLTMHVRLHFDESVTCEFCSKVYKNEKYLKKHHRKHHSDLVQRPNYDDTKKYKTPEHREDFIGPRLLFPCEPCGHQFKYRSMLVAHLKGKHNMQLARNEDYPNMWTMEDLSDFM